MAFALPQVELCPCLADSPPAFRAFLHKVAWRLPPGSKLDAHMSAAVPEMLEVVAIVGQHCIGTLASPGDRANAVAGRLRFELARLETHGG